MEAFQTVHPKAGTPVGQGKGYFVTLEGPTCSGKTHNINVVGNVLADLTGRPTRLYADPYSAPAGGLRDFLLEHRDTEKDPVVLAALYMLNRQILWGRIEWDLEEGFNVVCDRWTLSTLVYQGASDPACLQMVEVMGKALRIGIPDATVILDIPYETYRERLLERKEETGILRRCDCWRTEDFEKTRQLYIQQTDGASISLVLKNTEPLDLVRKRIEGFLTGVVMVGGGVGLLNEARESA